MPAKQYTESCLQAWAKLDAFHDTTSIGAPTTAPSFWVAAVDAFRLMGVDIVGRIQQIVRDDERNCGRSPITTATGSITGNFNVRANINTPDIPGNEPDIAPLLQQIFNPTVIGGYVQYKLKPLTESEMTSGLVLFAKDDENSKGRYLYNGIIRQVVMQFRHGEKATWDFSGECNTGLQVGYCEILMSAIIGATSISVGTTYAQSIKDWSYNQAIRWKIGTDDNAGAGFNITNVDVTTGIVTLATGLLIAVSASETIVPLWPAQTLQDEYLVSGPMNIAVDGFNIPVRELSLTLDNLGTPNREGGFYGISGGIRERVAISGTMQIRATQSSDRFLIQSLSGAANKSFDFEFNAKTGVGNGNANTKMLRIHFPRLFVLEDPTEEGSDGQAIVYTFPFRAFNNVNPVGEDMIDISIGTI